MIVSSISGVIREKIGLTGTDSEELHDLLDYREMILQLDIESQIVDSYFTSIADTLTSIDDYIQMISEQAATKEQYYSHTIINETIEYHVSGSEHDGKQRWIMNNNKSPAEKSRTFVILYKKEGYWYE